MSEERVSHFNAITELPELWNKNIEQIDLSLREVSFFNKDHALFVQGFIERQIKYHEWDGRLRKTSDRLQFAIAMGQTVESSYLLDAQLTGEYYIFQPEQYGKNRAILDQGFILTVRRLAA
ncbi:MAG TPA: hypothetical protein DDW65_06430, partial [Firmicutes bacterium]|nr:hypothetical protein [Bacillota bacterium]